MNDLKTILIAGNASYTGALLVRKLLQAKHKVKTLGSFIYRQDTFIRFGPADTCLTIRNINLINIEDDFHKKEKLQATISDCNIIIYFPQTSNNQDHQLDYDKLISLIASINNSGTKRLIYILDDTNYNLPLICHKKTVFNNCPVIVVNAQSGSCYASQQKLKISLNIFSKSIVKNHTITLFSNKQTGTNFHSVLPNNWYGNHQNNTLDRNVDNLANLYLKLSEQPLRKILRNIWPHIITYKSFLDRFYLTRKFLQMLEKPHLPFSRYIKYFFRNFKRLFDVSFMMLLVHLWPEQAYRFSTRKLLPNKTRRFQRNNKPIIPYELIRSRTSDIPKMKEANVVLRGSTFDIKKIEKLDSPIFLLNFWHPLQIKKDVIYITSRAKNAIKLRKLGFKVIFSEVNLMNHKGKIFPGDPNSADAKICERIATLERIYSSAKPPYPVWAPSGSGLSEICALSYFAEKINVYGWDFYLNSSPGVMTYWQLFFDLYKYKLDLHRSRNYLESAIINFYYGYHFSKLPNINIYGYLGQLNRHEKLIGKLERVLFNS